MIEAKLIYVKTAQKEQKYGHKKSPIKGFFKKKLKEKS